jgi:hypothetical protein
MPIDPTSKPTDEDFDSYAQYLDELWTGAMEDMAVVDGVYYQTENIWADFYTRYNIPESQRNRPNFHSGLDVALVEQAVASHMAFQPSFHRVPLGTGLSHKEASGRLEKGLQAVYYDAMVRAPNMPATENGKQIQLYNVTQLGTLLDTDSLIKPVKRQGEKQEDFELREHEWEYMHLTWNPIKLVVPKPGEVLMNPKETVPGIAIQRCTMKAYELHEETMTREVKRNTSRHPRYTNSSGIVFTLAGRDAYEDVDVEIWWSARWVGVREQGGPMLYIEPNMWGIQPWSQVFGGNAVMPSNEPWDVRWWVRQSLMWREIPTLRMLNQALVSHHAILQRAAWARMGTTQNPAEAVGQLATGILAGNPDDWWVEQTPQLPGASFQHLSNLQETIERTTFSSMVAGFRQAGVDTATGMIILSESANRTFRANITKLEHLHTIGGSNVLKLKAQIGEQFTDNYSRIVIGEDSLDDKDIGGKFHIQARFHQVDPVAQQQEVNQALTLWQTGLVGDEYVYRVARIEDPAGTRKDAIKSIARRDPEIIEQLKIDALREEGMQELADKRQAAFDLAKLESTRAAMEAAGGGGAPMTGGAPMMGGAPATNGARPAPAGIPEGGQYGR